MLGKKTRTEYGGCIIERNLRTRDKGFRLVVGYGWSLNKDQPGKLKGRLVVC